MSLLTAGIIQGLEDTDTPEVMINGLKRSMVQIEDSMVRFRSNTTKLQNNNLYSADGRKQKIAEAAMACAAELDKIKSNSSGYYDLTEQLQKTLKPDTRPDDSTLAFLQEQEIRQRLSDLDPLELQVKYMDACGSGGPGADLIAAAVEGDPMPRLSEEVLQEGRQARGKRKDPEAAKKLQHVIHLKAGLEDALAEARAELEKNGLPVDDWLTMVATGKIDPDKD